MNRPSQVLPSQCHWGLEAGFEGSGPACCCSHDGSGWQGRWLHLPGCGAARTYPAVCHAASAVHVQCSSFPAKGQPSQRGFGTGRNGELARAPLPFQWSRAATP